MLLDTPEGSEYTGADGISWMKMSSFRHTSIDHQKKGDPKQFILKDVVQETLEEIGRIEEISRTIIVECPSCGAPCRQEWLTKFASKTLHHPSLLRRRGNGRDWRSL
jgi:Fe-S oxidoreductase